MMLKKLSRSALCLAVAFSVLVAFGIAARAETVKLGIVKTASTAGVFIAIEKGYFAAEGLTAELYYFDASEPIAVAVVSAGTLSR